MLRIGEENVVTCKYPNAFGLFKLDLFLESVPLNGSERTTKNPDLTLSVELTTKLVAVPDHNGQNITCSVSHQPNFDQAVSGTLYVECKLVVGWFGWLVGWLVAWVGWLVGWFPHHNGQNITCSVSHQPNFDQAVSGILYVECKLVVGWLGGWVVGWLGWVGWSFNCQL